MYFLISQIAALHLTARLRPSEMRHILTLLVIGSLSGHVLGAPEPGATTGPAPISDPVAEAVAREKKVEAVVDKALSVVVAITTEEPGGTGSGVIVSPEGLILTAAHVTDALEHLNAKEFVIIFPDGKRAKAKNLGANRTCDSAMIKITDPVRTDWPCCPLGSSDAIKKGDWVVALGQPGGFEVNRQPPVRVGRVWGRDNFGALFSDCMLIGGDSGGPLFDLNGGLVGIHSSIGLSFFVNRHVPVANFQADWARLHQGEHWGRLRLEQTEPERPVLGVQLDEEATEGLSVLKVIPDTPAAKAGVQAGDILTHIGTEALTNYLHYVRLMSRKKAGDVVKFTFRREAKPLTLEIGLVRADQIGQSKAPPDPEPIAPHLWFGAEVEDNAPPDGGAATGIRLRLIAPESPAAQAGLLADDIITALDGQPISDAVTLARKLATGTEPRSIKLRYRRGSEEKETEARLLLK
jgi:serine protease Do